MVAEFDWGRWFEFGLPAAFSDGIFSVQLHGLRDDQINFSVAVASGFSALVRGHLNIFLDTVLGGDTDASIGFGDAFFSVGKELEFHGLVEFETLSGLILFKSGFLERLLEYKWIYFEMGLFGALHIVIFCDLDFFRKVFAGFFEVEWVRKVDNRVIFGVKEENLAIDFFDGVLDFDSKRVEFGFGGEVIF